MIHGVINMYGQVEYINCKYRIVIKDKYYVPKKWIDGETTLVETIA